MSEVKKGDNVVVQIEGRLRNKAIFVPVYVESEDHNGSFDAWAPSGQLRRYPTSQIVYFAKSMIDAEAWAEEHIDMTVKEFKDIVNSSEDSKCPIESSTKQWYTVYIHNNESAASRGYDMDTRDVIRIKCESDDEAFVKACDLIEEHWEDPDDAFDHLKNQDVTSGDPFVYAIEDPSDELIFDLGFKDIEEYFEDIESCVTVEASTKYYGLFEYFPGSPEDGMSDDRFDLLEVVEAPSEEAAVKLLNPPADDDGQFVRELTKEDYELYGVDLTYPLDPSKISASSNVWPEELTYDEYDEGDQIIDTFIEVIDDLGFFEEPSAQGGVGSDFIYDENDNLILEIDLQKEQDILTDFYYSSISRDDFKKKISAWLKNAKDTIESSETIQASTSSKWWKKYYDEVSLEELCELTGYDEADLDQPSSDGHYRLKHVAWLIAKPRYENKLDDYFYVELVDDNGTICPAVSEGGRVYDVSESIRSLLNI